MFPVGLVANDPIHWSFTSGLGVCTGAPEAAVCNYSGTGELAWTTLVSDGGTALLLLGLGVVALGAVRQRFAQG